MAEKVRTETHYAEPGDVECDFCTGRKRKARESCLMCLASYCKTHVRSHYQSPAFKKHKLIKASQRLQEKICPQHDKLIEIYCQTDQSLICYMCMMDEHKGHDTVDAAAARLEKESDMQKLQAKSHQRLHEKQKKLQEIKQTVNTLKSSAQAAVEESERIFSELICVIKKKRSELIELIRDQEKSKLRAAEDVLKEQQKEVADLQRRHSELEQASQAEDHIQFLQCLHSLSISSQSNDPPSIAVSQTWSFDEVRKGVSDLKEHLDKFCKKFSKIKLYDLPIVKDEPTEIEVDTVSESNGHSKTAATVPEIVHSEPTTQDVLQPATVPKIVQSEPTTRDVLQPVCVPKSLHTDPKSREDFLQYFCPLTLDPNTVNHKLSVSENGKVLTWIGGGQQYSFHPERFDYWNQVLCKESLCGRCYWEVEWEYGGWGVSISVSYKEIGRKGQGNDCVFGGNNISWSLECSSVHSFLHNSSQTKIPGKPSSRIGVYLDHSAGTLSFYIISDTMKLLHKVNQRFTQPLYAGFWMKTGMLRLSDPNNTRVDSNV